MLDKFQDEYEKFQAAFIKDKKETDDSLWEYVIAIYGQTSVGKVAYNDKEKIVSCSCKKFEMEGILCSRVLKVLDLMNIKLIPDEYILKRWNKNARDGNVKDFDGHDVEMDPKLQVTTRYKWLCSNMIKIASRALECQEAYIFLGNCMKKVCMGHLDAPDYVPFAPNSQFYLPTSFNPYEANVAGGEIHSFLVTVKFSWPKQFICAMEEEWKGRPLIVCKATVRKLDRAPLERISLRSDKGLLQGYGMSLLNKDNGSAHLRLFLTGGGDIHNRSSEDHVVRIEYGQNSSPKQRNGSLHNDSPILATKLAVGDLGATQQDGKINSGKATFEVEVEEGVEDEKRSEGGFYSCDEVDSDVKIPVDNMSRLERSVVVLSMPMEIYLRNGMSSDIALHVNEGIRIVEDNDERRAKVSTEEIAGESLNFTMEGSSRRDLTLYNHSIIHAALAGVGATLYAVAWCSGA
ncbi:Zinc finger, PMZ-type [Corchorus olitorius]|uniref:Protein FAR1-RELATED SEQUENCE n=1 Tax=Corchorus olitorius TaxID=93759 RepID=A0A1R3IML8_9ROSI|nr:Zinc finger, PMZ-type [Corchorus olitorius]